MNNFYQKIKNRIYKQYSQSSEWGEILLLIGLVLLLIASVVAIFAAAILIPPLILLWAINTIGPIFGLSAAIPYTLGNLVAISVIAWVIQSVVFNQPIIKISIKNNR